jgi:hypothetical protein
MGTRQRLSNYKDDPLEDCDAQVIHLMVEYMKEFLEKPHPILGDMPLCPFARKARLEDRILYKVVRFGARGDFHPNSPVMKIISEFCQEGRYEVLLVIHPEKQAITQFQLQEFIDSLNKQISDSGLVAFGGHPDEDFNIQDVYTRQEPFLNFTVQTKQLLKKASDSLLKTDYYKNWTPDNLRYVGMPRGD